MMANRECNPDSVLGLATQLYALLDVHSAARICARTPVSVNTHMMDVESDVQAVPVKNVLLRP